MQATQPTNAGVPLVHRTRGHSPQADRTWHIFDGSCVLPEFVVEVRLSGPQAAPSPAETAALESLPSEARHVCRSLAPLLALAGDDAGSSGDSALAAQAAAACPSRAVIERACELEPQVRCGCDLNEQTSAPHQLTVCKLASVHVDRHACHD